MTPRILVALDYERLLREEAERFLAERADALRAPLGSGAPHALLEAARCAVLVVPRGSEQLLVHALEHGAQPTIWE